MKLMNTNVRRTLTWLVGMCVLSLPALTASAQETNYYSKGKFSRNFYRIPYQNGEPVFIGNHWSKHGGAFDVNTTSSPGNLVAMDYGIVEGFDDDNNECGCHGAFCDSVNWIGIYHANGEISRYYHMRQGSVTALGLQVGTFVSKGQVIGVEGDVGITCGTPGTSPPRTGPCVPNLPSDYPTGTGCADHLHFAVFRKSTGEVLVPMTCNVPFSNYVDGATYTAADCNFGCASTTTLTNLTLNSYGEARVYQAQTINASTVTVENRGSLVLHASSSVRLTPGFHADGSGTLSGAYFRAEIGGCDSTALGGSPISSSPTEYCPVICGGCVNGCDS